MSAPTISQKHTESDRGEVFNWLREFNEQENGRFMQLLNSREPDDLFLVARSSGDKILGGLSGSTFLNWLRVDIMAIKPSCRGQGIGRLLLKEAERIARERGCHMAYVDTMSFQAPGFYEGLGYQESGRLVDWDSHGHDKIFFTKLLDPQERLES